MCTNITAAQMFFHMELSANLTELRDVITMAWNWCKAHRISEKILFSYSYLILLYYPNAIFIETGNDVKQ